MTLQLPPLDARPRGAAFSAPERARYSRIAARHGRTGVAPFIAGSDVEPVELLGGEAATGYARVRRWAITPGDVVAPAEAADAALDEYLRILSGRGLRPAFMAVADVGPFARRGFDVSEIADEAVIDLPTFSLSGSKRANLRHSTTSARRAGLSVMPYEPKHESQLEEISRQWLRTKRGGEMGFTLSRHDDVAAQLADHTVDVWVIADRDGTVQGWCTWRPYLGGRARVIDVMRRRLDAPNPTMDCLLVSVLENYRDAGLEVASLASVPRDHGAFADRIYPTRSLRAYKQKFQPRWETRWLAVPTAWHRPSALGAIGKAYCPGGLRRAVRRNK